jgi:hypothetical protein
MDPIAKTFIIVGVTLIIIGVAWQFGLIQALRLGRLPGDISIQNENSSFYFPLTTSILLSVILSAVMWLLGKWK